MGKPKKGKKEQDEDFGDDDVDFEPTAKSQEMDAQVPKKSKGKAGKKARKEDDLDDVESELAAMALEANGGAAEEEAESKPAPKKKDKKKNKKNVAEDDDDEPSPAMSRFQMLTMSDDEADNKDSDEEDKASNEGIVLQSVGDQDSQSKSKKDKKKNKKAKTKTAEEEDVDAIMAALDEPADKKKSKGKKKKKGGADDEGEQPEEGPPPPEVEKQAPKVVTIDDYDSDEDTKKKKKKKGKKGHDEGEANEEGPPPPEVEKQEPKVVTIDDYESDEDTKKKKKKKGKKGNEEEAEKGGEADEAEGEDEEGGGTVKTAAQKKKEKKERERLKKVQKQQQPQKKEAAPAEEEEKPLASREATPMEPEAGEDGEAADEGKGKKKKKKGEKEEKEKKPKNAAMLAKIKEQQARIKKQEEERKRQAEEEERREEERIRKLEEEKRLEEERRQRKKLKKKEREEKLKREGKLLTAQQKQDRMRANQMLNNIKELGGIVPSRDDAPKKRPFYGKKKPKDQQKGEESEKSPSPEDEQAPELPKEELPSPSEVKEEVVKEEEEVKDEWDADSEDEVEEEKAVVDVKEPEAAVKTQTSADSKEESEEGSDEDEEESSEEESSDSESEDDRPPAERGREKVTKRRQAAEVQRTTDDLRAPVVCVLGHVDTGKTKILDKLRRTNVQDGEAGGITQQIGATNVPKEAILDKTKMCKGFLKDQLKLPGLLIIDTPGHESFSNLRSRGSSLCDIAILVVDIMHGLEPQTIESINLLKSRKTPFLVALNKIDRLYGWKSYPQNDVVNTIKAQSQHTKSEFEERSTLIITQLAEEGLNARLFYENPNPKEYVSLVPTSAHSGDGMGNLVSKICELTQTMLAKRISYSSDLQATVMEVKAIHGMGTTIDVILVNGSLVESQTIVLAGTEGPIITSIRGLLMPQPMKELRVKTNAYIHQKEVKAAQGVKIIAKDLEKSLAGLPLYVAHDKDEVEFFKGEAQRGLDDALQSIKLSDRGVFVQASTLGSLEALLEYLRSTKVKYAGINIGPVHKKDIMKASIMLEHDPQFAVILAFDVEVKRDVQEFADSMGVTIFQADIIYHLFDRFTEYRKSLLKKKQEEFKHVAVFPCKLKIMPQHIFNSRDPIVMGVSVQAGFLKEGTPICVPSKQFVDIGRVSSIEFNHKPVDVARVGQEVCIKIMHTGGDAPKMFGRHFEADDMLISKISRESIDAVKDCFREDMNKSDWMLMVELKKLFEIL